MVDTEILDRLDKMIEILEEISDRLFRLLSYSLYPYNYSSEGATDTATVKIYFKDNDDTRDD